MAETFNHAIRRAATVLASAGIEPMDVELQDFVRTGYRAAARYLRAQGMGLLRVQSSAISVATNATSIGRATTPALPTDLIRPIELRERTAAIVSPSTAAGPWTTMRSSDGFIPTAGAGTTLDVWDWRGDAIIFRGNSVTAIEVTILYEAELPALTYASSSILIPDGLDAIAWLGASFAAADGGKKALSDEWKALASADLDLIAKSETKVRKAAAARWGEQ